MNRHSLDKELNNWLHKKSLIFIKMLTLSMKLKHLLVLLCNCGNAFIFLFLNGAGSSLYTQHNQQYLNSVE